MVGQQAFEVRPVETAADEAAFLSVPERVYRQDPYWVPPLRSSIAKQFSPENPFFEYGELQRFIAIADSQPIGRIVPAINRRLIEREDKPIGLFGFFECIDDFAVAQSLLQTAEQWLRDRGITHLRGPIDLSTHNNCFFLIDGFDTSPLVMMPYNPPYYPQFMERAGWQKGKDAYAYISTPDQSPLDKFERAYRVACNAGVTFRSIQTRGEAFEQDCRDLYQLFTQTFANNWSATARTEAEFMAEARELQPLVDTDIFVIAEHQGKMVGFFLALPDYNIALKRVNGRLNWLGMLKFLWYRRQIDQARVLALSSLPEYRRKMVPMAMAYRAFLNARQKRRPYRRAELSWVYEDNYPSRRIIEAGGAQIYKTYRIYEKVL